MLFYLALATLLLLAALTLDAGLGTRRIPQLVDVAPLAPDTPEPRVSVVIAARDEARHIETALRSVLAQEYANLEVIAVDDRSTDGTSEILDRIAARSAGRLRALHLSELPAGWLGKNHALERGAEVATGELLLFTDADVVMAPSTSSRAVALLERERLDHLTLTPELRMPSALLTLFAGVFAVFFAQYARPWKARDPKSARHVGIGAFNLVRASVYRAAGGHAPIRMRPDDDLMLGKLLKKCGARQDLAFGTGLIHVEWYATLGEAARGLEKNTFAGAGYSVWKVIGSTLGLLAAYVWPFAALLVTGGATWWLNLGCVVLILATYVGSTRASGANALLALGFPLATLLLLVILWRAMLLALAQGGIRWRGTLYPLDELRANRV
jgi:hypothetical protein